MVAEDFNKPRLAINRVYTRRGERVAVSLAAETEVHEAILKYLNRLSDALFVWSRWASHQTRSPETLWEPNQASSQALT
jgi:cob(I)alamin adenosyltransferase